MSKYIGFEALQDIKEQFDDNCDDITDDEVLFASYGSGCYDGDAVVLIQRDGKLFAVEGGHCSCRGLEGQWDMSETTKEVLKMREFSKTYHPEFVAWLEEYLS